MRWRLTGLFLYYNVRGGTTGVNSDKCKMCVLSLPHRPLHPNQEPDLAKKVQSLLPLLVPRFLSPTELRTMNRRKLCGLPLAVGVRLSLEHWKITSKGISGLYLAKNDATTGEG